MDKLKADKALKVIERVFGVARHGWFLCFGTLLHLIRDANIEPDKDIDVGVFLEDFNAEYVVKLFKKWEYTLVRRIKDNMSNKYYYLSFKHDRDKTMPPIDVFGWFLYDGIRYHTYDVYQEGQEIPSRYKFLGVEDEFFPINDKRLRPPENRMVRSFFGAWNEPYFRISAHATHLSTLLGFLNSF